MRISTWSDLLYSLWDWDGTYNQLLPGQDLTEWLLLIQHDYDCVDHFYVDHETIGGG